MAPGTTGKVETGALRADLKSWRVKGMMTWRGEIHCGVPVGLYIADPITLGGEQIKSCATEFSVNTEAHRTMVSKERGYVEMKGLGTCGTSEKETKDHSPPPPPSLFNRITFGHLNPLLKTGYTRPVTFEDLPQLMSSERARHTGEVNWSNLLTSKY